MRTLFLLLFVLSCTLAYTGGPSGLPTPTPIAGEGSVGYRTLDMDSSTRALSVIDYDHHEIHAGFAFTVSSTSASLNSGNTLNMLLVTSATSPRLLHVSNQLESTGEGEITFVEAPTVTSSGTRQVIFNRRRPASRSSAASCFINCSYTGGTVLRNFRSGAGKTTGGSVRSSSEWILKPATSYVIVFTSRASGVIAELKSDWYEHEDKK